MSHTVSRDDIVSYLDAYLRVSEIPDASPNGLQVQGNASVSSIAYAVDASVQTIEAAVDAKCEMLIVHHGLWWGRHEQITGNMHRRVSALIHADLSLYTAHIPLDCHPEVGNNVELARRFGLTVTGGIGEYKGTIVGVIAEAKAPMPLSVFAERIHSELETKPDVLAFGPAEVHRVAIISGSGSSAAEEAARVGCDTLVTGETAHSAYHSAREAGINLIYGGHYATETVGLQALSQHLDTHFKLRSRFIPAPTGY